jgi:hypothetical protein
MNKSQMEKEITELKQKLSLLSEEFKIERIKREQQYQAQIKMNLDLLRKIN